MSETFEEISAKCRSFGVRLLRPKGMRKYFILEKNGHRFRLAKSWEAARSLLINRMRVLFETCDKCEPVNAAVRALVAQELLEAQSFRLHADLIEEFGETAIWEELKVFAKELADQGHR